MAVSTFFISALEESLNVKAEVLDASENILNTIQVPAIQFSYFSGRNRISDGPSYQLLISGNRRKDSTWLVARGSLPASAEINGKMPYP